MAKTKRTAAQKTTRKSRKVTVTPVDVGQFILNCVSSARPEEDWTYSDAVNAGVVDAAASIPSSHDLRADWWSVRNQARTGACVGFATADGVLRWHYVAAGWLTKAQRPSPRFIWMANKETDQITTYPTTFLEPEGTQTKLALNVARKYGCVLESDLPMNGTLSSLGRAAFYTRAASLRITTYHNLGTQLPSWRRWLATQGPILTRLNVDSTWMNASSTGGKLKSYDAGSTVGGHAVCLVGYTKDHFIVRNSWGSNWGDSGFAYASTDYATRAFTEAYGATL